jgi:hypothetical protein
VRGSHPELRHLVHGAEAGHQHVAHEVVAVLADEETAALLRGQELDERAFAPPVLTHLLIRAVLIARDQPAGAPRGVPRLLAELEHGLEVARATVTEGELGH